jgi:biofilm PGA synthesis N-glycosyltransferase PgaC
MLAILHVITWMIIITGFFNLLRLSVFMIAAEIYDLRGHRSYKNQPAQKLPLFTILIPAYNEEACIERTVRSVLLAAYPMKEIAVINDGSTDSTAAIVTNLQQEFPKANLQLITQDNAGKGAALNNGISKTTGELVMVIDADSALDQDALLNAVKYFRDKPVKALAASVRLDENGTWLGLLQRVEYLLAYRMKRSLTALNIEYIIGGVGSVYRRTTLKQVRGYRTNTITEDIDLSMKVIARGNKAYRVVFASDVRTSTQPVLTVHELIKQRYRWKQGRMQAFVRYRHLFMSRNKKHGRLLSWFQLPYAILGELYLIVEPIFIATIITVGILYSNPSAILIALTVMSVFMILNFIVTNDEKFKDKIKLVLLAPFIYLMMPVLSYVELVSLIKTIKNWRKLSPKVKTRGHWIPVQRAVATELEPITVTV